MNDLTSIIGNILNIQHFSLDDGPGIRSTVFFKGCNLRCAWCHNPESQHAEPQLMYERDKCKGCGKCLEKCPHALQTCTLCGACAFYCMAGARRLCGREYGAEDLLCEILADKAFYDSSEGGVTFSGGECMLQADFLAEMLRLCRANGVRTAVDTAGHVPFERFERILADTDLFLYDVKVMDARLHRQYVGVENDLILSNLAALLKRGARVWVRVPVVCGINDTEAEMRALRAFLTENGWPERIELLPYHALGVGKAAALGLAQQRFEAPDGERMRYLESLLVP